MTYQRIKKRLNAVIAFGIAFGLTSALSFAYQAEAPRPSGVEEGGQQAVLEALQAKQEELNQLSQSINQIQTEAFSDQKVQSSFYQYQETLENHMIQAAPDHETEIKRKTELTQKINQAGMPESEEEMRQHQELITEYQELQQALHPIENQVRASEEVRESHSEYIQVLIAVMNDLNPQTEDLLDRYQNLSHEILQLRQQLTPG